MGYPCRSLTIWRNMSARRRRMTGRWRENRKRRGRRISLRVPVGAGGANDRQRVDAPRAAARRGGLLYRAYGFLRMVSAAAPVARPARRGKGAAGKWRRAAPFRHGGGRPGDAAFASSALCAGVRVLPRTGHRRGFVCRQLQVAVVPLGCPALYRHRDGRIYGGGQ